MSAQVSKNVRILDMYERLREGKIINKTQEARKFGVDERSIQRDIDDIRAFLDERSAIEASDMRSIQYSRKDKGFFMSGEEASLMDNNEILAVSKILLASRAFSKKDISTILEKMIKGCVPQKNMRLVSDLISNEKYHYVEVGSKGKNVKALLWKLGEEIKACNLLKIEYQRQINVKTKVTRIVQPVAVLFSEYYFYLNAYIVEKDANDKYISKYPYPTIFRVDRILKCTELGEKFHVPYKNRFEEGEFRKRVQFMQAGELVKCRFRYTGNSVEAVLDRLPTATVLGRDENGVVIEAEVFGKGILMWLMSQGKMVTVLKPEALREEMIDTIRALQKNYSE